MGFELTDSTATVAFEDGSRFHGLEIVLSLDIPLALALDVQAAVEAMREGNDPAPMLRLIGGRVIQSWNLTRNGEPVPVSAEAFASLDARVQFRVLDAWNEALSLDPPMRPPSNPPPGWGVAPSAPADQPLWEIIPAY